MALCPVDKRAGKDPRNVFRCQVKEIRYKKTFIPLFSYNLGNIRTGWVTNKGEISLEPTTHKQTAGRFAFRPPEALQALYHTSN